MQIDAKGISLRNIEIKDIEFLRQMMNDKDISKMTVGESAYITQEQQLEWYKNLRNENDKIRFMIDINEMTIGTVILEKIDMKNKSASISIKIGNKELKNKGYATKTIKEILKYAFSNLNLNRVYAKVLEYNEPSKKLFLKCGFKIEGIERKAIYKNNEFNDLILFSMLRKEFIDEL